MHNNFTVYKQRRKKLLEKIQQAYPDKSGIVVLFGSFEHERYRFRQNSSFYYFTGVTEPAIIWSITPEKLNRVFVPHYGECRTKWASSEILEVSQSELDAREINAIVPLGVACKGYNIGPNCNAQEYESFLKELAEYIKKGLCIFTVYTNQACNEQSMFIDRLSLYIPELKNSIIDISECIASLRRTKTQEEIEEIYKAVDCTMAAHEGAACIIEPDKYEYEVQAGIEFVFTQSGGTSAFPSIVASGAQATILHYNANNHKMNKNELVIVDIGAELNYYCADLTRTYPISGVFTKRQKEVYRAVLDTQEYIASTAKPGYWLSNKDKPEKSLHHLAKDFLRNKGFDQYFTHGIGHFLGLDVHDVGNYAQPLQEGDVITIEPGIYIPNEKLGVRIEDNYWIVADGAICLSHELPKAPEQIEEMMVEKSEADDFEENYN